MKGRRIDRTAAMLDQRKNESKDKRQAVLSAISVLERTQSRITVAEVARRARVSPWLVRQRPLLDQVRQAQDRASTAAAGNPTPDGAATGSHATERLLLRQENQRLREETVQLKQRISELLGDRIDGTDAITQTRRADELANQNAILSQQAAEALGKLHQLELASNELASELSATQTVNRALMAQLNRSHADPSP